MPKGEASMSINSMNQTPAGVRGKENGAGYADCYEVKEKKWKKLSSM